MNLKLLTPTQILVDTPIEKIDVEALDGFFTLLPRHIDFVTALKSGILTYVVNEKKYYAACDHGVLVKKGDDVRVSTTLAVLGKDLDSLKQTIATTFKSMEQERKELNISITRLELGLTKGLMSLSKGEPNAGI
ncbi:MAG: F0F1 ATP synthase subunit epsilon [Alphaproteobacteria bacterium]|nr:F0F1 ATP synthase subunit epsilon [Alphaproteobacteria bacterium]